MANTIHFYMVGDTYYLRCRIPKVLQYEGGAHKWVIMLGIIFSIILGLLVFFFFATITASIGKFGVLTI